MLLPVETRGQAALWHKNSNLCLNDGTVGFWWFRGCIQCSQCRVQGLTTQLLVPIQAQFTAYSCLLTELTTQQTLVLMVGEVKRNTSLTLLTVLVLPPILSSCKIL